MTTNPERDRKLNDINTVREGLNTAASISELKNTLHQLIELVEGAIKDLNPELPPELLLEEEEIINRTN